MSLKSLQTKIGVKPDGVFGPNTLNVAAKYFKLSDEHAAHLFGQCAAETGDFNKFVESLNYSAEGLRKTFKKYFPTPESRLLYANKPQLIANKVYANRMGNGDESSGDGWKFIGRGGLQTTGKSNYKEFSEFIKDPKIMQDPSLVATKYAFEAALFYFNKNNLWKYCNEVTDINILKLSKSINLGSASNPATPNGLEHRSNKTKSYYNFIKDVI
jgi:putative chitinase